MNLNQMIENLKKGPDFEKIGMIASHVGIVRGHSLNGKKVKGMELSFDHVELDKIKKYIKKMDGIIHVLVDVSEGSLAVGDEVMAVVVGGDTREHVFPALIEAVNRIKSEATKKREIY
jgi:molybdopterin synthase catalytic subunit